MTEEQTLWKPINTAPLDGTSILLLTKSGMVEARFAQGEWEEHHEYGRQYNGPVWVCLDDEIEIEVEENSPDPNDWHHGMATHWMPLPKLPTT